MDDYIASAELGSGKIVYIACLARQTVIDSGASHMGFGGYFIFEVDNLATHRPINILAKAVSLESAFRIADLWAAQAKRAA